METKARSERGEENQSARSASRPLCPQRQQPEGSAGSSSSTEAWGGPPPPPPRAPGLLPQPSPSHSPCHLSTDRSQGRRLRRQSQSSERGRPGPRLMPEPGTATTSPTHAQVPGRQAGKVSGPEPGLRSLPRAVLPKGSRKGLGSCGRGNTAPVPKSLWEEFIAP